MVDKGKWVQTSSGEFVRWANIVEIASKEKFFNETCFVGTYSLDKFSKEHQLVPECKISTDPDLHPSYIFSIKNELSRLTIQYIEDFTKPIIRWGQIEEFIKQHLPNVLKELGLPS